MGHRHRSEHRVHGVHSGFFALVSLAAVRALAPALEIFGRLLGSHELLHTVQNGFSLGHTQAQGLPHQLLPFQLHYIAASFAAVVLHPNYLHPEFHATNLPRSTSLANRWLASCRLSRSRRPYGCRRRSML